MIEEEGDCKGRANARRAVVPQERRSNAADARSSRCQHDATAIVEVHYLAARGFGSEQHAFLKVEVDIDHLI